MTKCIAEPSILQSVSPSAQDELVLKRSETKSLGQIQFQISYYLLNQPLIENLKLPWHNQFFDISLFLTK